MSEAEKMSFVLQFYRRPDAYWVGRLEEPPKSGAQSFDTLDTLVEALGTYGIRLGGDGMCETCGRSLRDGGI